MASTSGPSSASDMGGPLTEGYIQDCFHAYLKSCLTQAKAQQLLSDEVLSSAEADFMISGPALCLYFAALRSTTDPPSVALPQGFARQPMVLSHTNCPPVFATFLKVWAKNVPGIQRLVPERRDDLARVICNLPLRQPTTVNVHDIAADLRSVAIEISQRRSFQERYAGGLQAALDAGGNATSRNHTSFVPPPSYDAPPMSPSSSGGGSRRRSSFDPAPVPPRAQPGPPSLRIDPNIMRSTTNSSKSSLPSPGTPSIFAAESPAMEFIRETLYAALADQLERNPSLGRLLRTDPSRAYFGSVAFAVLDVATRATTSAGEVRGVLGQRLALAQCPAPLQPFMAELVAIGRDAKSIEEEDNQAAIQAIVHGWEVDPGRMEKVKGMLEGGVGMERARDDFNGGQRIAEARDVEFVNRINALSMGMMRLPQFRDRQEYVFKILEAVANGR